MQTYAYDIPLPLSVSWMRRARRAPLPLALLATGLIVVTGCASSARLIPQGGYRLSLGVQHPLTGAIYAGQTRARVGRDALFAALDDARYVVLGETHDNPDHHRLQAQLLAAFLAAHPHASVAFEMLDEDDVQALSKSSIRSPAELSTRVDWDNSGWPDFAIYRPVFGVALAANAPIVAAHPSAEHVRASMHGLSEEEMRGLHLDVPLPADQQAAQRAEIRESHCGHANPAMTTAMQRAQVYKDAFMARALLETQHPAVLIAGRGHARNDRAVPYFLRRMHASSVVSIAFIDVDAAHTAAKDYPIDAFDFVVFTPRVSDADPCEEFRKQLEKMHGAHTRAQLRGGPRLARRTASR